MSSTINEKEVKLLFALSGNRCAFPDCPKTLVHDASGVDDHVIVGEIAHIVAEQRQGPRGLENLRDEERNKYSNLLLLCREHHKIVDSQPLTYNVAVLRHMKHIHEERVRRDSPVTTPQPVFIEHEEVLSTLLQVTHLPASVFEGDCDFEKGEEERVRQLVKYSRNSSEIVPYLFNPGRLFAFHDLRQYDNPFVQIVDPSSVRQIATLDMVSGEDTCHVFVASLNSAMRKYMTRLHLQYDREHKRFFFTPQERGRNYQLNIAHSQGVPPPEGLYGNH